MQGDGWLNFEPGTWNCGHDVELWLRISIWILSRSVCRLPSILEQCGHHQSKPDPCHQSTWSEKKINCFELLFVVCTSVLRFLEQIDDLKKINCFELLFAVCTSVLRMLEQIDILLSNQNSIKNIINCLKLN